MEANLKGLNLASIILVRLPEIQNYAQNLFLVSESQLIEPKIDTVRARIDT